jgi:colicin import membrane protein
MESSPLRIVRETDAERALRKLQTELHESRAVEREVMNELLEAQSTNQRLTVENARLTEKLRQRDSTPPSMQRDVENYRSANEALEKEVNRLRQAASDSRKLRDENLQLQQQIRQLQSDLSAAHAESSRRSAQTKMMESAVLADRDRIGTKEVDLLREELARAKLQHAEIVSRLQRELDSALAAHSQELAAVRSRAAADQAAARRESDAALRRAEAAAAGLQQGQQVNERARADLDREAAALRDKHSAQVAAVRDAGEAQLAQAKAAAEMQLRGERMQYERALAAERERAADERAASEAALREAVDRLRAQHAAELQWLRDEHSHAARTLASAAEGDVNSAHAEMQQHVDSARDDWRKTEELLTVRITQLTDANQNVHARPVDVAYVVLTRGAAVCAVYPRAAPGRGRRGRCRRVTSRAHRCAA